jgi:uncharacterized membrane protein
MGLFLFHRNKSEIKVPTAKTENQEEERMFPPGWHYENKHFVKEIEDHFHYFQDEYISAKKEEKGILAVRSALTSFIVYMEDVEKICASKGETFVKWSKLSICNEANMEYYRNELKKIEDNLEDLIEKENLLNWLKPELLNIIIEEPGIYQPDIYKRFDVALKPEVSNQLYLLYAKGLITREKSGRSYKLYIR